MTQFSSEIKECADEIASMLLEKNISDLNSEKVSSEIVDIISELANDIYIHIKDDFEQLVLEEIDLAKEYEKSDAVEFIEDHFDMAVAARDGKAGAADALVRGFLLYASHKGIRLSDKTSSMLSMCRPKDEYVNL